MRTPLRSRFDPPDQRLDLVLAELPLRIGRRHPQVGIGGRDSLDQLALAGMPGVDDRSGPLGSIEAQIGLASTGIWPMTEQAVLGEDRANVAVEINLIRPDLYSQRGQTTRYPKQNQPWLDAQVATVVAGGDSE